MPDDDLSRKLDRIMEVVQEQNVKVGNIDGKVDVMNERINIIDDRMQDLQGIVMRREGAASSMEEIKRDLNKKLMWALSSCIALAGVIIAVLKLH